MPTRRLSAHDPMSMSLVPAPTAPARRPPAWDVAPERLLDWDLLGQPEPDFEYDQRMSC